MACGAAGVLQRVGRQLLIACAEHAMGGAPVPIIEPGWENIHLVRGTRNGKAAILVCRRYDRKRVLRRRRPRLAGDRRMKLIAYIRCRDCGVEGSLRMPLRRRQSLRQVPWSITESKRLPSTKISKRGSLDAECGGGPKPLTSENSWESRKISTPITVNHLAERFGSQHLHFVAPHIEVPAHL
jgi:hypothetical protein